MAKTSMNIYLQNLQRQISHAAARIKYETTKEKTKLNFADDIQTFLPFEKIDLHNYSLLDGTSHYLLLKNGTAVTSNYASKAYEISAYTKKPAIAEGLVFEYNREYDFKV